MSLSGLKSGGEYRKAPKTRFGHLPCRGALKARSPIPEEAAL